MRKHFLDIALLICVVLPVMADLIGHLSVSVMAELIGHLSSDARSVPGMTGRVNFGLANCQSDNFFYMTYQRQP